MTNFHILGFPRIGDQRQLKRGLESYWAGDISQPELLTLAAEIRESNWQRQLDAGVDFLTVGDFALYDQVLNTSVLLGHLPERVKTTDNLIDQMFLAARGRAPSGTPCHAAEMTKWFDTNYHYLVPECHADDTFNLQPEWLLEEIAAAKSRSNNVKPVIIGPLTYLFLAKSEKEVDRLALLPKLLPVYSELFRLLREQDIDWVQLDEPILALDLPDDWRQAFEPAYHSLRFSGVNVLLASYFGGLDSNRALALSLPVQGLHIDQVAGTENLDTLVDQLGPYKVLSVGAISGRNIWRTDLDACYQLLKPITTRLDDRLWVSTSCSLLHVPYDVKEESASGRITPAVLPWLAFAQQKLGEGRLLADALNTEATLSSAVWLQQAARITGRRESAIVHKPAVKLVAQTAASQEWQRDLPYEQRAERQQARWQLPLLPTTTIGSFPQTTEIRQLRRRFRQGEISPAEYHSGLLAEVEYCIRIQENIGLDVLVHGEAERNDMVEYFGELLEGVAVSSHGWVQSYGSRCVKPPLIFGDIERPQAMTVEWSRYAASLSTRPVKGMLTGPVTLLKWSFVRDDQPLSQTAYQLAAALRTEIAELESAGIGMIQVDEPALREALPLKQADRAGYLAWAVNSFRYATTDVAADTQIHTHMCYADFDDILPAIEAMDADVITLETARSASKLLDGLAQHPYHNGIGPGVYDIHSPNVPYAGAMASILRAAARVVPLRHLWVNPDCGLKTRRWEEVEPSLREMVRVAQTLRQQWEGKINQNGLLADDIDGLVESLPEQEKTLAAQECCVH
ncbi:MULTISPECIES: 5-methyltetrahydropteroyltriglutamate--homocysteine S-methyltransferase [unclassified Oceanobacter]|uniref:5-methyltetrahydropteroyltriglutamate-- homocysteine S-methyltransferase n=1 Tax=unclassified Oceanobacter TaxID=2620260 RepID=UPI00273503A4|nr:MULTISPECIES: 5-methyltetrahydropteroyltriglutamate--homocysteine S-methyltransferase [unclassified Oceanobacter]MDP2607505.1 5-methyltetrahydropteroyltriglutamate--homocysteine S-methyltransferase [Oceanobacter sp. 1_MG-2023]MDP2610773.1 5-methyltetrahydropteroyltriglutamate--homocysteine S-methyltransferase [Oceanobacter sp. 2_MG-2023]